jgi:hypothetical protein
MSDSIIVRFARWLEDLWPQLLVSVGTVVMAAVALPTPSEVDASWMNSAFYENNLSFFWAL